MFLGDQWIGTEPYKDGFEDLGLDAVVGSIGDGTTTRMIADIPGVKYTEGRFLPYFFPDTFYEGNDPSIEAWDNWRKARRAILRSPIARMGYGGYLSLAAKFPKFVDAVEHISDEFRDIHDRTGGVAAEGELNVAILNSWGKMRSWMAFTVAHALPNKQTYSYYGILESLSGMRVNVRFISFDDVLEHGVADDIDVIINGGPVDTAFTGGDVWKNPKLTETLRAWVRGGGAFVGVGDPVRWPVSRLVVSSSWPTCWAWTRNATRRCRWTSTSRPSRRSTSSPPTCTWAKVCCRLPRRRIPQALSGCGGGQAIGELGGIDFGEPIANTFPVNEDVTLLRADGGQVQLAVNEYGKGRGVYVSGLPYSAANAVCWSVPVLGLPQRGQVCGIQLVEPRVRGRGVRQVGLLLRCQQHGSRAVHVCGARRRSHRAHRTGAQRYRLAHHLIRSHHAPDRRERVNIGSSSPTPSTMTPIFHAACPLCVHVASPDGRHRYIYYTVSVHKRVATQTIIADTRGE